jgi:asparagine synthase (glutamine-hydrolysing)
LSGRGVDFEGSAQELARAIERSVASAVAGESKVAVAFSGGLDSSILAKCASTRAEVFACAAFAEGAGDEVRAREAASALGVALVATKLTRKSVDDALAAVDLPFAPTLMDRSLWCLYAIVSRSAHEAGARVMLLGQLADELFGGYAKYAEALSHGGEEAAASMMKIDVEDYARRGRVRDVGACGRWVKPVFPFEAREVVELASSLPVSFKIRDGVRKAVLRRSAAILGVPEAQASADKKAAQYSSGVQKLVASSPF